MLKFVIFSTIIVILSGEQISNEEGIDAEDLPSDDSLGDSGNFQNTTYDSNVQGRPFFLLLGGRQTTSTTTSTTTTSTTSTTTTTTTTAAAEGSASGRYIYFWEERYEFTTNWFQPDLPQWSDLIDEFQGKPVHLLEIGSYEGRSAVWMLDNICTHPDCMLTTIDSFEGSSIWKNDPDQNDQIERRFRSNIALTGKMDQVEIIKGDSFDNLIGWNNRRINTQPSRAFDFVYIDGAHEADAVLRDAMLVWPLLKNNGIIIFDDYHLNRYAEPYNNPRIGIDAFLAVHKWEIEILESNYQLAIRKVERERPATVIDEIVEVSHDDKLELIN